MIHLDDEVQKILAPVHGKVDGAAKTPEILDCLLTAAIKERTSDIHIEPFERMTQVRFRIDGQLFKVLELDHQLNVNLTNCVEVTCNMHTDAAMKKTAQDGHFSRWISGASYDFRVATFPTITGEKMTIRILYADNGLYDIANLGLTDNDYNCLMKILERKEGLVLVTGPTASGKTTTLYAILNRLHSIHRHIITIEDPVEYRIPGMNQCEISSRTGFTFADGLRSILRQDPDIILVGEIRDEETADITMRVAVTGHLVFSTLHARGAMGTVVRLLNMGLEPFMISYALNGSIAQRLVRRVCTQCRQPVKPDEKLLDYLRREHNVSLSRNVNAAGDGSSAEAPKEMTFYRGTGCEFCNQTGYRGRIAIFEILLFDEALRDGILRRAPLKELVQIASAQGFRSLAQDGLMKAGQGLTTLEEIYSILIG